MDNKNIEKIFDFATTVSTLKNELRFKASKDVKGDTVASHTWRMSLLVFMIAQELKLDIDVLRATKIALIHDLPEAITGDLDAYLVFKNNELKINKDDEEKQAMELIKSKLPEGVGEEIYDLWKDYNEKNSLEARFVYSMDKVEGVWSYLEFQNNGFHDNGLVATYHNPGYELFPELKPVLDYVRKYIKEEFKKRDIEWKKEYEV